MAKTLIITAIPVVLLPTLAIASEVSVYGLVDTSVAVSKAKGQPTKVKLIDGAAGGSSWGITGVETLAGGVKVGFTLERGFQLNNGEAGEPDLAWGSQTTMYISGPLGELALGYMGALGSYESSYSILDASAIGNDYLEAAIDNVFVLGQKTNNTVLYISPDFSGLKLYLQYSNGTASDEFKWSKNSHLYALGFSYEQGAFNLVGTAECFDNKGRKDKTTMIYGFSASYKFPIAKVYFGYQYARGFHRFNQLQDWYLGKEGAVQNAFALSADIAFNGGSLQIGANYGFGKIKSTNALTDPEGNAERLSRKDFDRLNFGVVYEYPLSQSTFVYTWGAAQKGGKAFKEKKVRSEFDSFSFGFGLAHNF